MHFEPLPIFLIAYLCWLMVVIVVVDGVVGGVVIIVVVVGCRGGIVLPRSRRLL